MWHILRRQIVNVVARCVQNVVCGVKSVANMAARRNVVVVCDI
jgi:hypothetical protein